jgi:xanthine phosphoribosyltransferase
MKKIYYTSEQTEGQVLEILRQIQKDNWKPDYIVGLTRGGLVPAVMISQYLGVPMHALHVSLRDSNEKDCESNLWMAEDAYGYSDTPKNILIVDDINDSGATLNWIKRDWEGGCLPQEERWNSIWNSNVRFAVLIDNQNSQFHDVDYSAEEINKAEEDCWVVFPWEEWWKKN